jgi:hypothetical protein
MKETAITLDYDPYWEALKWAKEHCPSYITNSVIRDMDRDRVEIKGVHAVSQYDRITYYFGDKQDAAMFAVRWS